MRTLTINSQDLGEVATIDTYNMFNGETVDDMLIEDYNEEHNTDYNYDDFEWEYDHQTIVKDLAKQRAEFLENECDAIQKCVATVTGSPREYNFSTDYAVFEITYDETKVEDYIKEHKDEYDSWYKESGWWSATEWRDDDDKRKDENREIARLDYYLNKTIDRDTAYYALAEHENEVYWENTKMELKKKQ